MQQMPGGGEHRRMPGQRRLVADVAPEQGLAHAVGADQRDVGFVLEEVRRHQFFDIAAANAVSPTGRCSICGW
jgi:hypothetical protein